ncbi:MAG: prepilin-type N-terminal cleavage/methylation domain-containing protein [Deltaproteobacteria bacterium]|nr:prepilin-type N-terminal cleavage/methylation domain-containing protein [Deltaproteobacteria bacterium]
MALRQQRSAGGFSVLEVMIALSILAFGMMAAMAGQVSALKTIRQSRTQMLAMYLAEEQMEDFQAMTTADVIAAISDLNYPNDPENPIDPNPNDDDMVTFNRRWFIEPNALETGLTRLTVEVDWVTPLGFTRTTTLRSMKAAL